MVNSLKKAVSTFVTLTTVLWSVGAGVLALPNAASAATLSSGDLIKASGPAVYYYAADGKRYVFPNETSFKSWFVDFSSVKTITDAELAAIQIGGNVTMRPGTKLVKITTDPKTYAVTQGGVLHWIQSEAIAKALYGDNWAQRVVDVSDAFFVNYTVGSSVSTNVHPDGQLVMYAGDTNYYVVMGGVKRKIASDAVFAANGWNKADAVMTTITYGNGSDVTGRESLLADVVVTSGGSVAGGALTVALASDTPAGMTVPKNAASVQLVKVNLTAGSADVAVSSLRFHRVGVGSVADFSNVYLYTADGTRLTSGRTINTSTNLVEFNNLNLSVKAGSTLAVVMYGDFSSPATTGGQHSFELVDAASVVVGGSSTVAGSFPVRGNVFTVGTTSASRVDVIKGANPVNPTIGSKGVEVSNFKLAAVGTNDIQVNQITLYQAGSITNSDLSNFQLFQGSTIVASAPSITSNGHLVLQFTPAFLLGNGTTKVFSLRADVAGRASRDIRFYVEYTTDVNAMDKTYNSGAAVAIATTGSFDGSGYTSCTVAGNSSCVTTQGGSLTNAFNGPATQNIAKGQLAVPLYKFSLTSPDNTLEVRKVVFKLYRANSGPSTCYTVGSASTAYFRSIKIKNLDTGATLMGPQEVTGTSVATSTLTYTDSFNISAGQTLNLALVADLSNTEDAAGEFYGNGTCAYQAEFQAFGTNDIRVTDTGEFLALAKIVPNTSVVGNALTVKSSSLNVALASTPVSGTVVKKSANVPVAGLTLSASAQSDVTVTSLTLTGYAKLNGAAYTAGDFAKRVTSLALFDGDTQVGLARAPDTSTDAAQISNMNLLIAKGTTKTLTVKATLASTATSGGTNDWISVGIAATADVVAQDQDANTVNASLSTLLGSSGQLSAAPSVKQTILKNGTLTIQADAHPVTNIVVAGKDAWIPLAQYKATAQYENMNIDRIAVLASSTAGYTADNADYSAIAIAQGGAVKGQDSFSSGATGTKDIDLSTNVLVVPKDSSLDFQVWAKLSAVQASSTVSGATTGVARSGHAPAVGLNNGLQTGEWNSLYAGNLNVRSTGAASGELVLATSGAAMGNPMVLRKSMPIVTKQSLSSTTLANVDQDLIKFQVAADSAGSIAWKQVVFNISKTSAVALTNFRLRRGATDLDTSVYAITNATSGADLVAGSLAAGFTGNVVVSFKPGQEESISGSGNVYTLHATVSGATSGNNVTTSFYRDATNPLVTGYLISTTAFGGFASSANIFHIDTSVSPTAAAATGTFVWSDNSEVPHSQAIGSAGGSRDWTNDFLVQDLSQSQTLSL